MTCKDCYHFDVCYKATDVEDIASGAYENCCCDFKDKSRIIELPCKEGDMVYVIKKGYGKILDGHVRRTSINKDGQLNICIAYPKGDLYTTRNFKNSSIGKTVFLTKKEAEQALKERENNA